MDKTKDKGDIKRSMKVMANGVGFLNGQIQKKTCQVPIILLDYNAPTSAHPYAKGERFALWIKLEDAQYKMVVEQLKPELKELTIWFTAAERDRLKEFLNMVGEEVIKPSPNPPYQANPQPS